MIFNRKNNSILLNDLIVLQSIFSEEVANLVIFDPSQKLVVHQKEQYLSFNHLADLQNYCQQNTTNSLFIISLFDQPIVETINLKELDILIEFTNQKSSTKYLRKNFLCFPNPDKSFRWIIPCENPIPSFLNLYNGSGFRAMIYRTWYQLGFRLGLKRWQAINEFSIYYSKKWPLEKYGIEQSENNYSIFTGTIGSNRKVLLEINNKGIANYFMKIPISENSNHLIKNEFRILQIINHLDLQKMKTPSCANRKEAILLGNIKPKKTIDTAELKSLHIEAIIELMAKTNKQKNLINLRTLETIKVNLGKIQAIDISKSQLDQQSVNQLLELMIDFVEQNTSYQNITVAIAHADFTPWNMYVDSEKIYVYDWELGRVEFPLLYDLFHFIFQSNTLIKHQKGEQISSKIEALKNNPLIVKLHEDYEFDFNWHWQFYLVYTASYYLPLYLQQDALHVQAHWLLRNWLKCLALSNKVNVNAKIANKHKVFVSNDE